MASCQPRPRSQLAIAMCSLKTLPKPGFARGRKGFLGGPPRASDARRLEHAGPRSRRSGAGVELHRRAVHWVPAARGRRGKHHPVQKAGQLDLQSPVKVVHLFWKRLRQREYPQPYQPAPGRRVELPAVISEVVGATSRSPSSWASLTIFSRSGPGPMAFAARRTNGLTTTGLALTTSLIRLRTLPPI